MNIFDTPEEMYAMMMEGESCRELMTETVIESHFDRYISFWGCSDSVTDEAKKYIVYSLACILNELKPIPERKMEKYFYDPDELIDELIEYTRFYGYNLDVHLAIGLCVYIIEAYLTDSLPPICEDYMEGPALEQIVSQMSDEEIEKIDDPVWERFLDKLLDEYDGDEDAVFKENDVSMLQNLVRQRSILPCDYGRM